MDNRLRFLYYTVTELWDAEREREPGMERPVQAGGTSTLGKSGVQWEDVTRTENK